MGRVKDELIEMQELVWYAFDHGMDLQETIAHVTMEMGLIDEVSIEEMYQDLWEEFL